MVKRHKSIGKIEIFKTTAKDRKAIAEAMGPYFPRPIYGYTINTADDGREVISLIEGPMYQSNPLDPKYCVMAPDGYQQETCHNYNFGTLKELREESYATRCEGGLDGCDCDKLSEDRLGVWPFTLEAQA